MKRRTPTRFAALIFGGALVASACGGGTTDTATEDAGTDSGSTDSAAASDESAASDFPQFVAATVGGGQLEFGSLEGQDTVLWFWAPW